MEVREWSEFQSQKRLARIRKSDYGSEMNGMMLEIPKKFWPPPRSLRLGWNPSCGGRLAAALYTEAVIGGAAACKLAGLGKAEFQHWLGEHWIAQPLEGSDFEIERNNLEAWIKSS